MAKQDNEAGQIIWSYLRYQLNPTVYAGCKGVEIRVIEMLGVARVNPSEFI
jgi:hypothetical protein